MVHSIKSLRRNKTPWSFSVSLLQVLFEMVFLPLLGTEQSRETEVVITVCGRHFHLRQFLWHFGDNKGCRLSPLYFYSQASLADLLDLSPHPASHPLSPSHTHTCAYACTHTHTENLISEVGEHENLTVQPFLWGWGNFLLAP